MKRSTAQHEPLVVPTCELSAVLHDWMDKHDARFSYNSKDQKTNGDGAMSSRFYIAEHTGIQPRSLWRILTCESKFTALSLADELLTAIERRDVLENEVRVVPNPRWTQEHWAEVMRERGCY